MSNRVDFDSLRLEQEEARIDNLFLQFVLVANKKIRLQNSHPITWVSYLGWDFRSFPPFAIVKNVQDEQGTAAYKNE